MKHLLASRSLLDATTQEGDTVTITMNDVLICIKHNDIGISIDYYDNTKKDSQPVREDTFLFDDIN